MLQKAFGGSGRTYVAVQLPLLIVVALGFRNKLGPVPPGKLTGPISQPFLQSAIHRDEIALAIFYSDSPDESLADLIEQLAARLAI